MLLFVLKLWIGTSACPPYHLAFVLGTSAEANLAAVKKHLSYFDNLPTGNMAGQAFRDLEWEKESAVNLPRKCYWSRFGGKYFTHDVV
jgi:fumarate hydratase class I